MLENWEEFTSLIQMTENMQKFSKTQEEHWKDPWHQPCRAKGWFIQVSRKSCKAMAMRRSSNQCMVDWWNLFGSTRQRAESSAVLKFVKIALLLGKVFLQWHITKWCIISFQCLKQWSFWMPEAAVDKEWTELETNPALQFGESQEEKGGYVWKHKRDTKKVRFASLMDICLLKNAELEPKLQKYEGRVVLWGSDTVKDDSGACAVFTEQGSSASQMTAATIMDDIARLPDCDGQAADAVSAYFQETLEDALRLLKMPKMRMSRCLDTSSMTQMAEIMGKISRALWYFWNETCTGIH